MKVSKTKTGLKPDFNNQKPVCQKTGFNHLYVKNVDPKNKKNVKNAFKIKKR